MTPRLGQLPNGRVTYVITLCRLGKHLAVGGVEVEHAVVRAHNHHEALRKLMDRMEVKPEPGRFRVKADQARITSGGATKLDRVATWIVTWNGNRVS